MFEIVYNFLKDMWESIWNTVIQKNHEIIFLDSYHVLQINLATHYNKGQMRTGKKEKDGKFRNSVHVSFHSSAKNCI